jgi:hypothetical protein
MKNFLSKYFKVFALLFLPFVAFGFAGGSGGSGGSSGGGCDDTAQGFSIDWENNDCPTQGGGVTVF